MKRFLAFLALTFFSTSAYADTIQPAFREYLESLKPRLHHVQTLKDWEIYQRVNRDVITCHAITAPYRTKAFEGVREIPFIVITYKGHNQFTLTINPGFIVDTQAGVILKTNNRSYIMDTKFPRTSWTFSSAQDVAVLDDMLLDGRSLSIRSYTTSDDTALDFYSLNGFSDSLKFLEKNCASLQTKPAN